MPDPARPPHILWTRRRAVVSALALAAVMAGLPDAGAQSSLSTGARTALGLWCNQRAARAIGRRYLAERPGEADRARLAHQLFGAEDAMPDTVAEIRSAVAAARVRDFARGDTVLVDGWILARSEARLCALCVLS